MEQQIAHRFQSLQKGGQKQEIISFLTGLLTNGGLSDQDRCWAYWNISDQWAMLRRPEEELRNHKKFERQLSKMDEQYLPWMVSDTTQKLTLMAGGHETYWNNLYQFACQNTIKTSENAIIRFESHRANVCVPMDTAYSFQEEHSLYALNNLKQSALELQDSPNALFFHFTYLTQAIGLYWLIQADYKPFLEESEFYMTKLLEVLNFPEQNTSQSYLPGTWERLNSIRSPQTQASSGIHNYIVQLVNIGEYKLAITCFDKVESYPLHFGKYFYDRMDMAKKMVNPNANRMMIE